MLLYYRRELPDYYKTISDPISLNLIKRKMKSGEYASLQDLADELGKTRNGLHPPPRPLAIGHWSKYLSLFFSMVINSEALRHVS